MKILIIQEHGRHEKNWNFRESENLKRALNRVDSNVEVTIWGLGYENYKIPFENFAKDCDVIILLENYDLTNWLPDISKFKALKIFWSIDSHCVVQKHIQTVKKFNINLVLCANFQDMKYFENSEAIWFPNAYPHDLVFPITELNKTIDLGFCGNVVIDKRQLILNYLIKNYNLNFKEMLIGNDMVKFVNSCKIHFNFNISYDINYRTFETLGCKTLLFTNYTPKLDELFEIDKHLIVYESLNDLNDKLKYYLKNETQINTISSNGYNHIVANHTYDNRALQLLNLIKERI